MIEPWPSDMYSSRDQMTPQGGEENGAAGRVPLDASRCDSRPQSMRLRAKGKRVAAATVERPVVHESTGSAT
jgi:hypothetical protein